MEKTIHRVNNQTQVRILVKEQTDSLRKNGKSEPDIISWLEVNFNHKTEWFEAFESVDDLAELVNIPAWKFYTL